MLIKYDRILGEVRESDVVPSGLVYQGTWNASTNSPAIASGAGTQGFYYIVSVTGTTTIDGVSVWAVGDWILFNGTNWQRIEQGEFWTLGGNTLGSKQLLGAIDANPIGFITNNIERLTISANTGLIAGTEDNDFLFTLSTKQFPTGAITIQRAVNITQPTYSFVGASTITNAATIAIAGAPIGGTNATITNSYAFYIGAGVVANVINSYGLIVNAQTGATNNYAACFMGGNVGIGTTGPAQKLDVAGNINLSGATANINSSVAILNIGDSTHGGYVMYPCGFNVFQNISGNKYTNSGIVNINDVATGTVQGSMKFTGVASTGIFSWMGNVGIGTTAPDANALLDLTSTTKAFLPPRMTTTQKNAIAVLTEGMVVYDTTLKVLSTYNGTIWV